MFRELYDCFTNVPIHDAANELVELRSVIDMAANKMKLKELPFVDLNDKTKFIFSIFENYTVDEATSFFQALGNAIHQEQYKKSKDWLVKDLDITLLD